MIKSDIFHLPTQQGVRLHDYRLFLILLSNFFDNYSYYETFHLVLVTADRRHSSVKSLKKLISCSRCSMFYRTFIFEVNITLSFFHNVLRKLFSVNGAKFIGFSFVSCDIFVYISIFFIYYHAT